MPGGDRTGPVGMGPMTGRGAGYCAGYGVPGFLNPVWGRGFWGWCRGGGWRHRHWFYATGMPGWLRAGMGWGVYPAAMSPIFGSPITKEQEIAFLKQQAKYFEQALNDVKNRIKENESGEDSSETS